MKPVNPQPVVVTTICSLCEQPWEAHGPKPTSEDCIRLLKAALAARPPVFSWPIYPTQWGYPYTITCDSSVAPHTINAVDYATPAIEAVCSAPA